MTESNGTPESGRNLPIEWTADRPIEIPLKVRSAKAPPPLVQPLPQAPHPKGKPPLRHAS